MNRIVAKACTALLLTVLLAACAAHVKIEDSWRNATVPAKTYKKLLVVAVTPKSDLRQLFENILTETLRGSGVEALPSYPLLADLKQADKPKLQAMALAAGADAVIITHGLTKEEHTSYRYFGGTLQERTAVMTSADADSTTVIAMSAVGIAPLESDFVKGTLMTKFFDTASTDMVWSALSEVITDGRRADACWDFSGLLTRALGKEHLIAVTREFRRPEL
jgi:hypothetical protein